MAMEQYNGPESQAPAPDAEILNVAEFLEGSGHEHLGALLEDLATLDDSDVDGTVMKELESSFARQMALMPEDAEMLQTALGMINMEFKESTVAHFNNRDEFLADLADSPTKYFKRVGAVLKIMQPGNSVTYTRIHDFFGPDGMAFKTSEPEKYSLKHANKKYTWSPENKTWEDSNGDRLLLMQATENIQLELLPQGLTKKDVYEQVWNAVQPQVDAEGTLRGGYSQIRNHLFMGLDGYEEAVSGERPDPVPRTYYYYGRQLEIKPEALAYTDQTPKRHEDIGKLMRMGYVRTAPTAGGGIATMIEAGTPILSDYSILTTPEKTAILDATYNGVLAMTNDYLDQYGMVDAKELSLAMQNKARFEARTESFLIRNKAFQIEDSGAIFDGVASDLYDNHVERILENGRHYSKALNKLPKPFRDKMIMDDILPSLKNVRDAILDDFDHSKKDVDIHIKQLENSLTALVT